ncbi:hypothetical protein C8R46DRAFT_1236146 [Mycena filopes]|nr:hypothetical protein C8R46DRAFT_1236146 [Mycena filopes]
MHPALDPSKLSELPFSLRRFATQAASGSEPDVLKVLEHVRTNANSNRFLPLVWSLLDPARVPDTADLDCPAPARATLAPLIMADHALSILEQVDPRHVPSGVYSLLWPRVWPWMELIHIYRPLLPHVLGVDPLSHRFFAIIFCILVDSATRPLVDATVGVYTFAGVTWSRICLKHPSPTERAAITGLHHLFVGSEWPFANLEELIDGTGGLRPFARLVREHIAGMKAYCNSASGLYMTCLSRFLHLVYGWTTRWPHLLSAFRAARLVRTLTATLIALAEFDLLQPEVDGTDAATVLAGCFSLLEDLVCGAEDRRFACLPEALHAGLLRALVAVSSLTLPGVDAGPQLRHWIRRVLPGAMVYYPVVSATLGNRPSAEITANERFTKSSAYPDWLALLRVIATRTSSLEVFRSPQYLPLKFCDNYTKVQISRHCRLRNLTSPYTSCKNIKRASESQCCSGCRGAHYCSLECQRVAWNDGHRGLCAKVQFRVESFRNHFTRRRHEAFLRHMVLQDYKASKTAVLRAQVLFARANPTIPQLCTLFDYSENGECTIRVVAPTDAPLRSSGAAAARLTNSATNLHYVLIASNVNWRGAMVYCLRSTNTILEDGVFRIAAQEELVGLALTRELKILSRTPVVEACPEHIQEWLFTALGTTDVFTTRASFGTTNVGNPSSRLTLTLITDPSESRKIKENKAREGKRFEARWNATVANEAHDSTPLIHVRRKPVKVSAVIAKAISQQSARRGEDMGDEKARGDPPSPPARHSQALLRTLEHRPPQVGQHCNGYIASAPTHSSGGSAPAADAAIQESSHDPLHTLTPPQPRASMPLRPYAQMPLRRIPVLLKIRKTIAI